MSKSNTWDVLWSPSNPNKFIRFDTSEVSNEISLYHVYREEDESAGTLNKSQMLPLADDVYVKHAATNTEFSSIKCISWCPKQDLSDYCVLATGLSNGRVYINSIGSDVPSNIGIEMNQEFHPKMERPCNDLAWNVYKTNLLAAVLDKVRYDNSLTVWDVEASSSQSSLSDQRSELKQPIFGHGAAEHGISVEWNSQDTLVAGMAKWIRRFDIRSPSTPEVIVKTNAIYGICMDPHNNYRIASFAKGQKGAVLVWDIRYPDKPLITLNQSNAVSKILWCPKRNNMISVLHKDSDAVKYYDLQSISTEKNTMVYGNNSDEEHDNTLFERNALLPKSAQSNISSYCWHPFNENSLLAVSTRGTLHILKIFERIITSWSPSFDLTWACGHQIFVNEHSPSPIEEDISHVMRERALLGYGEQSVYMKDDNKLKDLLKDSALFKLWMWLKRTKHLKDHEARKIRKFLGVKAIIKGDAGAGGRPLQSTVEENPKNDPSSINVIRYTSEDRKLAIHLCEWDLTEEALKERLNYLIKNGEMERAAAMALFNNKISWTIDVLSSIQKKREMDSLLPIVAMALSGYSENRRGSMWVANCKKFSHQLKNPYLRAMFAFLTSDDDNYANVLKENGMDLKDRIAFACKYIPDSKLITYVENVTTSMIASGGLEGLLLTGLTSDGIDLLENYITKNSDVQTAVLIVLNMKISDVFKDERVVNWIDNYRELLDQWRLWHKRAQFDSHVQASAQRKIPNQISVTCTYCSKPVSSNAVAGGMRMSRTFPHGTGARQNKAASCPGCRKPLPRCSICLNNMGSLSSHLPKTGVKQKVENPVFVNPFQNWFTWCQKCRHGGHASHLADWFTEHVQCPVTGCSCSCSALDNVTPQDAVR